MLESEKFYYSVLPNGLAEISTELIDYFGFSYVGKLPLAENEIGITKFSAEIINSLNFHKEQDENIIGNCLVINEREYLITAIINTHFDVDKYATLKEVPLDTESHLADSFYKDTLNSVHNLIFVNNIQEYCSTTILMDGDTCAINLPNIIPIGITELVKQDSSFEIYKLNDSANGYFVSAYLLPTFLRMVDCNIQHNGIRYQNYGDLFVALCYDELEEEINIDSNLYLTAFDKYKERFSFPTKFNCSLTDIKHELRFDVIVDGFYTNYDNDTAVVVPDDIYQYLYQEIGGEFDTLIVSTNDESIKQFISKNDTFRLNNFGVENINKYWDTIEVIKKVAYILSGIFAFFSIALLLNFMLQGVTDKTKIIGILKANGCNNLVLSKIFILEGLIIACAVFVLVALLLSIICLILNSYFIHIAVFVITIPIFPVLAILISVVSVLGSLLPIVRMKRLLPNDVITRI